MPPRTLTVLAPIRQGEETRLREILRPIGNDIRGKRVDENAAIPRMEFLRSRRIHFARFAILADPDRGPNRSRLLYSSNYDGELHEHLAELIAMTSDMDAVWGRCEGYGGVGEFERFVRAHAHEPEAFYIAFRDETVETIRDAIALRRAAHAVLEASAPLPTILTRVSLRREWIADISGELATTWRLIAEALARVTRALPIVADLFRVISRCGIRNVVRGTQRIVASLDRYPLFRALNRLTKNRMPPQESAYTSVSLDSCAPSTPVTGDEMPIAPEHPALPDFREDVVSQNQLTVVTVVKPGQEARVRAVMAAINSFSKRLASPGSLIGISTIHFVKWLVIDEGRRLLMISDYDGSWESYIDEFAEMILSGLDAIWETSYGFPCDGARDVAAFKAFLRNHQVPAEIFFSAYPDETVLNILNDRAFARASVEAVHPLGHLLRRLP